MEQWVEQLKKFQPNIIIGYPSAIKILAELVEQGQVELSVSRVISCGEPLGAGLRTYLETVFAATVINTYGASESLALGVNGGSGMLLFDDLNVIEVTNYEKSSPKSRKDIKERKTHSKASPRKRTQENQRKKKD